MNPAHITMSAAGGERTAPRSGAREAQAESDAFSREMHAARSANAGRRAAGKESRESVEERAMDAGAKDASEAKSPDEETAASAEEKSGPDQAEQLRHDTPSIAGDLSAAGKSLATDGSAMNANHQLGASDPDGALLRVKVGARLQSFASLRALDASAAGAVPGAGRTSLSGDNIFDGIEMAGGEMGMASSKAAEPAAAQAAVSSFGRVAMAAGNGAGNRAFGIVDVVSMRTDFKPAGEAQVEGDAAAEAPSLFPRVGARLDRAKGIEPRGMKDGEAVHHPSEDQPGARSSTFSIDVLASQSTNAAPLAQNGAGPVARQVGEGILSVFEGFPESSQAEERLRMQAGGAALKTIQIQLKPEALGKVDVTMKLIDGQLNVELVAQKPETALRLSEDSRELHNLLDRAGFKVDDAAITITAREPAANRSQATPNGLPFGSGEPSDGNWSAGGGREGGHSGGSDGQGSGRSIAELAEPEPGRRNQGAGTYL